MSQKRTRKCHTCKPGTKKIVNINNRWELPELFKKISPKHSMPDCTPDIEARNPKNANLHDKINLGEKYANRTIFFFAAHPKNEKDCDIILEANKAYGDLSNQGITHTNSKGVADFSVRCPQGYREEGNTYISHIHFVVSNKNRTKWIPKMKTQRVACNDSHKKMKAVIKTQCAVVLNALGPKYYIQDRIPNSYNLPYNLLKDKELTDKEVIRFVRSLLPHYKKLNKSVKDKKLKLREVPIVVYCYYHKCNASEILMEHLIEMGFKNVREYKLGIQGWRKRVKKNI